MGGVAQPALCAAVAEAGGIGTVAMVEASPDEVKERVAATKALTARPFSANFIAWLIEKDSSPLDAVRSKQVLPRSHSRLGIQHRSSIGSTRLGRCC